VQAKILLNNNIRIIFYLYNEYLNHNIMLVDPEIEAIQKSFEAMKGLDDSSKKRVLQWLVSKFTLSNEISEDIKVIPQKSTIKTENDSHETDDIIESETVTENDKKEISDFETISDLFSVCNPKNGGQKALIVAAFLQEKNKLQDIGGQQINKELKHLGHGASNITADISSSINQKPQLMIQTRKEGTSQQAKKKYKVTTAGLKFVKSLISNGE
jgi:hypothetical protein